MAALTKETNALQDFQNALYRYLEFAESWNNQHPLNRGVLSEDYRRGEASLVYHLKISFVRPNAEVFVGKELFPEVHHFAFLVFNPKVFKGNNLQFRDEQVMFIDDVEAVKTVEGISVPSSIRLYAVQEEVGELEGSVLLLSRRENVLKAFSGRVNRELEVSACVQNAPCVIERDSQIVNGVAKDQRCETRDFLGKLELKNIITGMQVTLVGNDVFTVFGGVSKAFIEIIDVLTGPIEF